MMIEKMKLLPFLWLLLFTSSCKVEQTVVSSYNSYSSVLGTKGKPSIFWGMISGKTVDMSTKRGVTIYFYENGKILYRFMSQECLGGESYKGAAQLVGNELTLSIPLGAFTSDYHRDIFIGNFIVRNDSTLISSEKNEFKRVESSKENIELFEIFLKKKSLVLN